MSRPPAVLRRLQEETDARLAREASVVESSDLLSTARKREEEAFEKLTETHQASQAANLELLHAVNEYMAAISARKIVESEPADNVKLSGSRPETTD